MPDKVRWRKWAGSKVLEKRVRGKCLECNKLLCPRNWFRYGKVGEFFFGPGLGAPELPPVFFSVLMPGVYVEFITQS